MTLRLRLLLCSLLTCGALTAQSCDYQILLQDLSRGDGWNGGQLSVRTPDQTYRFTLGDGQRESVFFPVTDGDSISLDYQRGLFPEEVSFVVLDNDDNILFEQNAPATGTNIFRFIANCSTCAPPPLSSVDFFRARFNSVDLRFRRPTGGNNTEYLISYGPGNYDPAMDSDNIGQSFITPDSLLRITDLGTNQAYNFYLATICAPAGDTSRYVGPFRVTTDREKDVGVTLLASPQTGCDLGNELVTIGITNFGGAPQQFFDVGFLINGQAPGINRPFDGIFTGVVGVDSTEFFTFDISAALSEPGEYRITAYTDLSDDEDSSNDNLSITVTHQPNISNLPYTEDFEEDNGLWITDRAGRGPISWAWGAPRGEVINRAPQGRNAWATNLSGDYFNGEESYLISPCFDFTNLDADPYFTCALIVDTETDFDDLRLEMTTDGGRLWTRINVSPSDINWYNDRTNLVWEGDGGFSAPGIVGNTLSGAAGEEIQLRFVFESDLDDTREGILIDAVHIYERPGRDVALINRSSDDLEPCAARNGYDVELRYQNLGTEVVDTVIVGFRTLDGTVADTLVGRLAPGNVATAFFPADMDRNPGTGPVEVFATTPGDELMENDTAQLVLNDIPTLPFLADFDDGATPEAWDLGEAFSVGFSPSLNSQATVGSLTGDTLFTFRTAFYAGPFWEFDTLRFRFDVNRGVDKIKNLRVSIDPCEAGMQFKDFAAPEPGEYAIALENMEGGAYITFALTTEGDSVAVAFDDIGIVRCESLGLETDVVPASSQVATDGRITIIPGRGTAPYRYEWSTGDRTQGIEGLSVGEYSVTVTDQLGCSTTRTVSLRDYVGVEDPRGLLRSLSLAPNPTSGEVLLSLTLPHAEVVAVTVFDARGRQVMEQLLGRLTRVSQSLDLSQLPAGLYTVRTRAGAAMRTQRVVRR